MSKIEPQLLAEPIRAQSAQRYFRTRKGEYGEGDHFLGIAVPALRQVARKNRMLAWREVQRLLMSPWHEERLLALIILVDQFTCSEQVQREKIFHRYLSHTRFVNNWDLVDISAPSIVGGYLLPQTKREQKRVLFRLARSSLLWDRRIAMLATFPFIKKKDHTLAFEIAIRLLNDPHDLIHKAVGWMLREIGKNGSLSVLEKFLFFHANIMPSIMLRYAIEKMPEAKRKFFLARNKQLTANNLGKPDKPLL